MMPGDASAQNSQTSSPAPRRTGKSGVVIPHRARFGQRVAARLVWLFVLGLGATVRFRVDDRGGFFSGAPKERVIFAIWHNRLGLALKLYNYFLRRHEPGRKLAGLVSASKDGGFLAHVLELFQVEPVRGSSSRRGPQALRELVSWGERGYDLAITPDGPRGPRYTVRDGVIATAQLTGFPILPISYRLSWKIQLKSWDRFQLPLPFSICEVVAGKPMVIPREATESQREELRQQLEAELRAITHD